MSVGPLLLVVGRELLVFTPGSRQPRRVTLSPGGSHEGQELFEALASLARGELPSRGLGNAVGALSSYREGPPVRVGDRTARALAEAAKLRVSEASSREVASLREALPPATWEPDRELLLGVAAAALEQRLASPEEVIITLSREGDRLQRLLRKEREALSALSGAAAPGTPVSTYAGKAEEHLRSLDGRMQELDRALNEVAVRTLPNSSAVVGSRTAARLLALAGSTSALLRLNSSRLQVLGARRRRPGTPGPRHGVMVGAEGMDRVPPHRRGALARSLASLLVVAVRADLQTQGSVGADLVERRERRIAALAKGRPRRRAPFSPPSGPARLAEPRRVRVAIARLGPTRHRGPEPSDRRARPRTRPRRGRWAGGRP
ncbi:MAG: hypothetical protein KGJ23_04975 [Euryarchaeota archaeon]|nr:hypothetical protein [Euryarchaeota archaeon]MDE1835951.1 hypothetical protein [Euryarchaeota archaeon]MDE1880623.1 hypothetical protein [Euryarchaeota archaeon]MDE2044371.1 hypothetical protein [Thermoplasmata archaeon]